MAHPTLASARRTALSRMRAHLSRFALGTAVAGLSLLGGCRTGALSATGELGGAAFTPDGTVFAWVDAHDATGAARETPRLVLGATWLVLNPTEDWLAREGHTLEDWRHAFVLRESMALVFEDANALDAGSALESVTEHGIPVGRDALLATVRPATEPLRPEDTVLPLGERHTVKVSLDTVSLTEGSEVSGRIRVQIAGIDADTPRREGIVEATFTAPVIAESIAEHNVATIGGNTLWRLERPALVTP